MEETACAKKAQHTPRMPRSLILAGMVCCLTAGGWGREAVWYCGWETRLLTQGPGLKVLASLSSFVKYIIPSQDRFENLMGCSHFVLIKIVPAAND